MKSDRVTFASATTALSRCTATCADSRHNYFRIVPPIPTLSGRLISGANFGHANEVQKREA